MLRAAAKRCARSCATATRCSTGSRDPCAELGTLLPGLGGARAPRASIRRACSRRCSRARRASRSAPVLLVIEDLHGPTRPPRSCASWPPRSATSRSCSSPPTAPTSCSRHPLRLLRRAERVRALRIDLAASAGELGEQLADILSRPPDPALVDRLYARSEGALFTEELLAAGMDGRGAVRQPWPPRWRCDRAARRRRAGGRPVLRRRAARRRARRGRRARQPRAARRAAGGGAGHIVVLSGERYALRHALLLREAVSTSFSRASEPSCIARSRALWNARRAAEDSQRPARGGDRPPLPRGGRPAAALAARPRRHRGDGRPGLPRGGRAVRARARALGPRAGRRRPDRTDESSCWSGRPSCHFYADDLRSVTLAPGARARRRRASRAARLAVRHVLRIAVSAAALRTRPSRRSSAASPAGRRRAEPQRAGLLAGRETLHAVALPPQSAWARRALAEQAAADRAVAGYDRRLRGAERARRLARRRPARSTRASRRWGARSRAASAVTCRRSPRRREPQRGAAPRGRPPGGARERGARPARLPADAAGLARVRSRRRFRLGRLRPRTRRSPASRGGGYSRKRARIAPAPTRSSRWRDECDEVHGEHARAGRELAVDSREPQYLGVLGALQAELAGRAKATRRARKRRSTWRSTGSSSAPTTRCGWRWPRRPAWPPRRQPPARPRPRRRGGGLALSHAELLIARVRGRAPRTAARSNRPTSLTPRPTTAARSTPQRSSAGAAAAAWEDVRPPVSAASRAGGRPRRWWPRRPRVRLARVDRGGRGGREARLAAWLRARWKWRGRGCSSATARPAGADAEATRTASRSASRRASARCSRWSPRAGTYARSAASSTWRRRPRASTCRGSWPSWTSARARRRRASRIPACQDLDVVVWARGVLGRAGGRLRQPYVVSGSGCRGR